MHLVGFIVIIQGEYHVYTFRHAIAIFRESKKYIGLKIDELCFMICILLYFIKYICR